MSKIVYAIDDSDMPGNHVELVSENHAVALERLACRLDRLLGEVTGDYLSLYGTETRSEQMDEIIEHYKLHDPEPSRPRNGGHRGQT